jgi:hypothetical protein
MANQKDEMYQSFEFVNALHPKKVYYSGFVPSMEMIMYDINVEEIPKASLSEINEAFLKKLGPDEILIVDSRSKKVINSTLFRKLKLSWSLDDGYGQYIFKKES